VALTRSGLHCISLETPPHPTSFYEDEMQKNLSTADRIIRTIMAVVIGLVVMNGVLSGFWAVLLSVLAMVFLLTSFVSFCPLYLPFRFSTLKSQDAA
jgi:hypothetical protein